MYEEKELKVELDLIGKLVCDLKGVSATNLIARLLLIISKLLINLSVRSK